MRLRRLAAAPRDDLACRADENGLVVELPPKAPDPVASLVVLRLGEAPRLPGAGR